MDRARLLMTISVRQQGQVASAFDSASQLTLVFCTSTGDTAWDNLTAFGDVVFQRSDMFMVDLFNAFRGETAELATTEITCHMASLQTLSIQSAGHAESLCSDRSLPCGKSVPPEQLCGCRPLYCE